MVEPALPVVSMWTDGACKGNPGVGGWGVLLRSGVHERELFGGEPETTNNRMELTAVIQGLSTLARDGAPRERLLAVARFALAAWPAEVARG